MNENRGSRGPSRALLLLIPAALIIAKGARRRRAMWATAGPSGYAGPGFGHRGRMGGAYGEGDPRAGFRPPPRLEQMLDTWHTRAHETTGKPEGAASDGSDPAPATEDPNSV